MKPRQISNFDDIILDDDGCLNGFDIAGHPDENDDFATHLFLDDEYDDGWW